MIDVEGDAPAQQVDAAARVPSPGELIVALVCILLALACTLRVDDLFWLVRVGQDIVREHHLPTLNRYSFTAPDATWQTHEWLSEVMFYGVHAVGGAAALFAVGLALCWAPIAIVAVGLSRRTQRFAPAVLGTLLVAIETGAAGMMLRPYLIGRVFLALTLTHRPHAKPARAALVSLVAFALWANFHGSFAYGLVVLAIRAVFAERSDRRAWVSALLGGGVGSICTPLGISGVIAPLLYLATLSRSGTTFLSIVREWQPIQPGGDGWVLWLVPVLAGAVALALSKNRGRQRLGDAVLLFAFAVLALRARRGLPDLGLVAGVVVGTHVALGRAGEIRMRWTALPLAALVLAALILLPVRRALGFDRFLAAHARAEPAGALGYLGSSNAPPVRLFNEFDWGGALLATLYPRTQVFIDQRNDCYPTSVFADYVTAMRGGAEGLAVLRAWKVDGALLSRSRPLADDLTRAGWQVGYQDAQAILFLAPK